jgi:RNA methyltransferase, TrmH family
VIVAPVALVAAGASSSGGASGQNVRVVEILTNPRADRVRAVRALTGRSARARHEQFLVEGPQGVREAVRFAAAAVRDVYVTVEASQRYPEIVDAAGAAQVRVHLVAPDVVAVMSADAQGVLAVVRTGGGAGLDDVLPGARLVAALAQVRDPGNAGTVIRAADAAGADAVVLSRASVDLHTPTVVRSSAGSLFHLPVATGAALPDAVASARAAGLQVLAADGSGDVVLDDAPLAEPTMWLFGNEAHGLDEESRSLADDVVRIPIHGRAESLNLAMAATLCLYASASAHRSAR